MTIALPGYIDPEAWAGFEEMRKLIRKPMTDRARKLVVYELDRLKRAGHCPNASLDQSTLHNWADVYAPQDKSTPASGRLPDYKPEEHKASAPPAGWAKDVKARLRRVA